jgi:cytochrome c oxidase cbb3-type subunit 1
MFGVFGFWCLGSIIYLWPKLVGKPWWSDKLNSYNYWLTTFGVLIMFLDLMIAGVVQGYLWMDLASWERSIVASAPFWHTRSVAGLMIITGQMLQAYNMWMTTRARAPESAPSETEAAAAAA